MARTPNGRVAEWSIALSWKGRGVSNPPQVRILSLPLTLPGTKANRERRTKEYTRQWKFKPSED